MTALWILVGLQLAQFACTVILFRFEILRHRARKRIDIANNEMVLHIMESRRASEHIRNPWYLYEPGSVNHPAAKRAVDKFQTALGALEYADAIYPGVRVEITDGHFDIIPTQDVRAGMRVEAS